MQVANHCAGGRLVSCLEGGYNINGGLVSPFARSVEAHVWKLQEEHLEVWDTGAVEVRWSTARQAPQAHALGAGC